MNTPNKLTLFRMIMVIPFIALLSISFASKVSPNFNDFSNKSTWSFFAAGIIFIVAMITDYIDGYLARKNKQVTTFGKLFDPLADKIITTTAMIFLSLMGIIPFYLTIIFVLRDVIVDGLRNLAASKKIDVAASIWGKAKTMIQSIGITVIFFIYPIWTNEFGAFNPFEANYSLFILNILIFTSTGLSVFSGMQYLMKIKPHIETK